MIPILFLVCVVAIKVFKKITPNGECAELPSIPPPRPDPDHHSRPPYLARNPDPQLNRCFCLAGKITVYLGKRDFIDHLDYVDPIDGIIVIENDYLQGRRVFGQVHGLPYSLAVAALAHLGTDFRRTMYL
jgi:hypothetical protein